MERYEYGGRTFQIKVSRAGKQYTWAVTDHEGRYHSNMEELAPTEDVASSEAKFWIRQHYPSE